MSIIVPGKTENKKPDKVADIQVARNKRKSKEGRYRNLAQMYVDREESVGQAMAALWLWRELSIQGVDNIQREAGVIEKYIKEIKGEDDGTCLTD